MAFRKYRGKTKTIWFPRPASQAFTAGDLCYFNGSGQVIPADSTSGAHIGVIRETVASTDADYATADVLVPIEVPIEKFVEWEVDTSSAVADDIGNEIDLTNASTANRAASSKDALLVTGYKSASKLIVTILSLADNKDTATT